MINCSYNFGNEQNNEILTNLETQKNFITEKKIYYSNIFHCQPNDIIITNFKLGLSTLIFDVIILSEIPNLNDFNDNNLETYIYKSILEACCISPSLFDKRYNNKENAWGTGQKRGPPHHLMEYDPPLGFIGLGLNVLNKYDWGDNSWLSMNNIEGEWYIAYHGTKIDFLKDIINKGFGAGSGQTYEDDDNINELSYSKYKKCGKGV